MAQLEYASAFGCLIYLIQCTRFDIEFAVNKMSRFTSNINDEYWKAITINFSYLLKTKNLGLHYSRFPIILEAYTDASWISNVGDYESTSGWKFTLAGGVISWKRKKQTCITLSTMESEFVALASAGIEAEWLMDLLLEVPLPKENVSKVLIHCDSQVTLARAFS
ncbi:secreted RxLR effector protein 161-like [Vicia villosa]|uniref:secreted RxLR effector protein 161-like n=1 Tax=Vicia villosa TaxID=3911 RepID=UPI00273CD5B2|nr:secreted RxLR effector protein 161-like [Vicia villosa]